MDIDGLLSGKYDLRPEGAFAILTLQTRNLP